MLGDSCEGVFLDLELVAEGSGGEQDEGESRGKQRPTNVHVMGIYTDKLCAQTVNHNNLIQCQICICRLLYCVLLSLGNKFVRGLSEY
jgi:hypothetical protein